MLGEFERSKQEQFLDYVNQVVTAQQAYDDCFSAMMPVLNDPATSQADFDAANKKCNDALEGFKNAQALLSTFVVGNKNSIIFD